MTDEDAGPRFVMLASDALLALFYGAHPLHAGIVNEITFFSEIGLEPLYPFPALVALRNESFLSENPEIQRHANIVISQAARSSFITMPVSEDVDTSSMLANLALLKGLKISFLDTTILAMARRMGGLVLTADLHLLKLASSLNLEAVSEGGEL